jgi:C-terminal processing protease CtpA/Prc
MPRSHRSTRLVAPLLALALAGCSSSAASTTSSSRSCGTSDVKADVLSAARDWYLWKDELSVVDPAAYQAPSDLLDALTAQPRAEGKDRGFSHLTTQTASAAFFGAGQNLGFGFGLDVRGARLFVAQTFPGSAVAAAGLERGDEVLAIAASQGALGDDASRAADIISAGTLSAALSSGVASTRFFRVLKAGAAGPVDLSMTSAVYSLDPVPGAGAPLVLSAGAHRVGYLPLRAFIGPADDLLRSAAGGLKAAGVTDLIVDLRYNGGGLIGTAVVLTDLLGGARTPGQEMFRWKFNDAHAGTSGPVAFSAEPNALSPGKVAFIVRSGSASASELVINALMPYLAPAGAGPALALVGERTYGKPVGQFSFYRNPCDWLLLLISFQLLNSSGTGDYFQGLPDASFTGASCLADDDLGHPMGDAAEASTAAALRWIADGSCAGGPIPPAGAALLARREAERVAFEAQQPEPTLAQRHVAGLY